MTDLNFNITARLAPTNRTEYIALLDEALRLLDELNDDLTADTANMEKSNDQS